MGYATTTLEEGINPKKSKKNQKKIKIKSPIFKHPTTLLCNYYIGRGNQPKKIKKKSKKNQKKIKNKIKLKSPIFKHPTTILCNYYIGRGNQPKKNQKKIKKKSK